MYCLTLEAAGRGLHINPASRHTHAAVPRRHHQAHRPRARPPFAAHILQLPLRGAGAHVASTRGCRRRARRPYGIISIPQAPGAESSALPQRGRRVRGAR